MDLKVLYEDNHLIAVFKPSGLLVQEDKTGDICLMDEVKKYLKDRYKKPGNVFLGLVHRLDRPVSGIVLFAKTSKGASRVSEQFRNHEIEKIYHAVVLGKPPQSKGDILNYISKDRGKRTAKIGEGKLAKLSYEVIFSDDKYSLLKIKIETGKFHQIRSQLSAFGFPIVGDVKYGAPFALQDKSICLCATSLSFKLATKDEKKTILIPFPEEWKKYKALTFLLN
jgi:23S rRNA pseudouridine1911/1915/1917 synthase